MASKFIIILFMCVFLVGVVETISQTTVKKVDPAKGKVTKVKPNEEGIDDNTALNDNDRTKYPLLANSKLKALSRNVKYHHVVFIPKIKDKKNYDIKVNIFNHNSNVVVFGIIAVGSKGNLKHLYKNELSKFNGFEFDCRKYESTLEAIKCEYLLVEYLKIDEKRRKNMPLQVQSVFNLSDCQTIIERVPGDLIFSY